VLVLLSESDTHRCHVAWANTRHRVLEVWLCAQQGKEVVCKRLGRLCDALGLRGMRIVRAPMCASSAAPTACNQRTVFVQIL
jgi:hypothetical protein